MADDFKVAGSNPYLNSAGTAGTQAGGETKPAAERNKTVSQDEFLNLLVHQLQNQDPLDPMKNEEFAVQLATFSQLEQLVQINGKLEGGGASGGGSIGTMASFLGQQVTLKDSPVSMTAGTGPDLLVDMPTGARSARVDFLDATGRVVGSHVIPEVLDGKQALPLEGVRVPNGEYEVRVVAVSGSGQFVDVESQVTGVVEGFVLEPESALLVGGKQVTMENVVEVSKPVQRAS
ncbi:MAG: hypothetical protein IT290_02420 [Deltaproteobacteria bacterium]|nr:hypothetical protein [Deltaproteobacteria bacterium]